MGSFRSYGEIVRVRPEVLSEQGVVSMVDLAPVAEPPGPRRRPGALRGPHEQVLADPEAFFAITYPSEEVRQVLWMLARRLARPDDVSGTLLLTGRYGLGKSHVLLAAHHALTAPDVVARWAQRWGLEPFALPRPPRVVTRNFIHRSAEHLWQVFFESLGTKAPDDAQRFPDGATIEAALPDEPVVLIWDELERWYDAAPPALQSRDRNFLQALSEVARRDPRLTLLTSVLGDHVEPGATLRRVRPLELGFRSVTDRAQVLLFRLFEDFDRGGNDELARLVDAYGGAYEKAGLDELDTYRRRMVETYPFSPEFLDILTKKIPNTGNFQNTRGTLGFLSDIIRHTHRTRPLVTSKDLPLGDSNVRNKLAGLDTTGGEIVRVVLDDDRASVKKSLDHKDALISTILFSSIADPSRPGATEAEIVKAVLDPGENANAIRHSLERLKRTAPHLHVDDQRFVFKAQENPHARINAVAESDQVTDSQCHDILLERLVTRWGDRQRTAVFADHTETVQRDLSQLGRRRPKFLLSARSLTPSERVALQNLDERRNLVLLVEPVLRTDRKDESYNLLADEELRRRARRIQACNLLIEGRPARESETIYVSVRSDETRRLDTEIAERYGRYVGWNRIGASGTVPDPSWYELHSFDDFKAEAFLRLFGAEFSSQAEVELSVKREWESFRNREAQALVDQYERKPGLPVPFREHMVEAALLALVEQGALSLIDERGQVFHARNADGLSLDQVVRCVLIDPQPVPSQPPLPDSFVHHHVSAQYVTERGGVLLQWTYPRDPGRVPFRTLVQRYGSVKGWQVGSPVRVDLDGTRDTNRYIDGGSECFDDGGLEEGAVYFYYVFLLQPQGDAEVAILSQRCDVLVPMKAIIPPDRLHIAAGMGRHRLLRDTEVTVMQSKNMATESRARKLVFALRQLREPGLFAAFTAGLGLAPDQIEATGSLELTLRGVFSRQDILDLVRKLPDHRDAVYELTIHLDEETSPGQKRTAGPAGTVSVSPAPAGGR